MRDLKPRTLVIAAIGSAMLAAACAATAPDAQTPRSELTGTRWVVQTVNGVRTAGSNVMRIVFGSSDRLSGSGGCNNLSGFYETEGGSIDVRALSRTERACADAALMRQEEALVDTLAAADRYRREGETLVITAHDGRNVVLTPASSAS